MERTWRKNSEWIQWDCWYTWQTCKNKNINYAAITVLEKYLQAKPTYLSLFFHPILKWKCAAVSDQTIPVIIFAEVWACTCLLPETEVRCGSPCPIPSHRVTWGLWEWLCWEVGELRAMCCWGSCKPQAAKKPNTSVSRAENILLSDFPHYSVSCMSESQGFSMVLTTCCRFHPAALWKLWWSLQGHCSVCKGTPRSQWGKECRAHIWVCKCWMTVPGFLHIQAGIAAIHAALHPPAL